VVHPRSLFDHSEQKCGPHIPGPCGPLVVHGPCVILRGLLVVRGSLAGMVEVGPRCSTGHWGFFCVTMRSKRGDKGEVLWLAGMSQNGKGRYLRR
jgi:hypothetical protein